MRIKMGFQTVTAEQLRDILAQCSKERDSFHPYDWRPRVTCEGPEHFSVTVAPVNPGVATRIIHALSENGTV